MRGLLVGIYVSPNLRSPCRVCNHANKTTVDDTAPRIVKRLAVRPCSSGVIATMEPFHFDAVVPVPSLSRDGGGPRVFAPAPAFVLRWIMPAAVIPSYMYQSCMIRQDCIGFVARALAPSWSNGALADGAMARPPLDPAAPRDQQVIDLRGDRSILYNRNPTFLACVCDGR